MLDIIKEILKAVYDNLTWIVPCVLFCVPPIRDFIIKRFQLSLDKARDNNVAVNERKTYISKVRFDKEFGIYEELSEKNLAMVYSVGQTVYFVKGMRHSDDELKDCIKELCNAINNADFTAKRYASFINEDVYDQYYKLHEQASVIFSFFKFWGNEEAIAVFIWGGKTYTREEAAQVIISKQKELSNLSDKIIKDVRNYLNTLDVID